MNTSVEVGISSPTTWIPPFINEEEVTEIPLSFGLLQSLEYPTFFYYVCNGCRSAGGEIDDLFRTSSSQDWGDEAEVPAVLRGEMLQHARQHEIMWRWSRNRDRKPEASNA